MIEFAMLLAVGFLAASLFGLLIAPLVTRRARRLALVDLQRRMPVSMSEIAARRDAQRAVFAVELRQLEQRVQASDTRWTESRVEAGRQVARIVTLDKRHAADRGTIANLEKALDEARQALRVAEATVAQQASALHETVALSERRHAMLEASTARVAVVETLIADQRTLLQELEGRLAADPLAQADTPPDPPLAPVSEQDNAEAQARTGLTRLRTEQELTRKALAAATGERDRLRLRVDELLLKIEDLDDKAEETAEQVAERQRHVARQAKAIETLTAKLRARDDALAALRQQRNEAATTPPMRAMPGDAAALRQEVATLAAALVSFATTPGGSGEVPPPPTPGVVPADPGGPSGEAR